MKKIKWTFFDVLSVILGPLLGASTRPSRSNEATASSSRSTERHPLDSETDSSHALAEHLLDTVARIGPDFAYRYISAGGRDLFGYAPEEMIGHNAFEYVHPEDRAMVETFANSIDRVMGERKAVVYRLIRKDGQVIWCETTARMLSLDEPQFAGEHVVVHRDISDRVAFEQQLMEQAHRDGLTNLANRRAFDSALQREWTKMQTEGKPLSLLMGDVDHFKAFNDHYGHQLGDECLRSVANVIARTLERRTDMAARYGGEEIAVILPNVDSEGAWHIAEKLRVAVERLGIPHAGNDANHPHVSITFGGATMYAFATGAKRGPETLIKIADAALYRAKSAGRNRVMVMDAMACPA